MAARWRGALLDVILATPLAFEVPILVLIFAMLF
jgi:hypothetical protein